MTLTRYKFEFSRDFSDLGANSGLTVSLKSNVVFFNTFLAGHQ